MTRTIRIVAALAVLGAVFAAGSWVGWRSAGGHSEAAVARNVMHYACPMHPQYHSDKPGDCPSCGMRLEPVYADDGGATKGTPADAARLVKIDPAHQQLIGVKVGTAEMNPATQVFRTVGRVTPDERRTYRIISAVDGWIEEVGDVSTGALVAKDERLGSFYSPEFLGAEQAYIFSASALQRYQKGNETPQQVAVAERSIRQAADSLRNMGMSPVQIAKMARDLEADEKIWLVAPEPGFVLARNISIGQRFEKGTELFQIADLSRVWILADVFENQAEFVKPGTRVRATLAQRGREYIGLVSSVQPLFDEASRTLKARIEVDNPGFVLKPGMFVDIDFPASVPAAVSVPSEAVVDSGLRRTVFVDRGNGYFEPRRVETGWRMGDRVQIVSGLSAGDRIAVSGAFLLDSESRMRAAAAGIVNPESDPVCGMDVDREKAVQAGRKATYEGATYYFCSDQCKKDFEKNPKQYLKK